MPDLLLALFAGILTIAAPCTLPVLPILLGASIGQRAGARPAFIVGGFVVSFAFVALGLNTLATVFDFDPDVLRKAGLALLMVFGVLMVWPAAFERLAAPLATAGDTARRVVAADGNLGGLLLGATLGLIWTPCAGPVLGAILTAIATSPNPAHGKLLLLTYTLGAASVDARRRLWRTNDFDALASRRASCRKAPAGLRSRCHRFRAERVPAI